MPTEWDAIVPKPNSRGVMRFTVFRVVWDKDDNAFSLAWHNAGNAGGVLAHLHTFLLPKSVALANPTLPNACRRYLNANAIVQYAVTVKNPIHTWGAYTAFDEGLCPPQDTAPCANVGDTPLVGVRQLHGLALGHETQTHAYNDALLYSFPGSSLCHEPRGTLDCAWTFRVEKVIPIDVMTEMEFSTGAGDFEEYCRPEYDTNSPLFPQNALPFWQDMENERVCNVREQRVQYLALDQAVIPSADEVPTLPREPAHAIVELDVVLHGLSKEAYDNRVDGHQYPVINVVRKALLNVLNGDAFFAAHDTFVFDPPNGRFDVQFWRMRSEGVLFRIHVHSNVSFAQVLAGTQRENFRTSLDAALELATPADWPYRTRLTLSFVTVNGDFCFTAPCMHGLCHEHEFSNGVRSKGRCECISGWTGNLCDVPPVSDTSDDDNDDTIANSHLRAAYDFLAGTAHPLLVPVLACLCVLLLVLVLNWRKKERERRKGAIPVQMQDPAGVGRLAAGAELPGQDWQFLDIAEPESLVHVGDADDFD